MSTVQPIISRIKAVVPTAVKRPVRRAIPSRYHHYFDREWHRRTIGNMEYWDYMGRTQLDYLVERGLEPQHQLLDVGCGPLRAGIHFIAYLEPGHYVGTDKRGDVLETARLVELPQHGLEAKEPLLVEDERFDFGSLGRTFDYAMAQSVFTHVPLNSVMRCLVEMGKVLRPGGRFYASIFENPHGKLYVDDIRHSETAVSHYERDFYHYDLDTLRFACEGTGLTLGYEGDYGHPNDEKMLVFTRE
jgi:SAM-dependent methyltransferase